MAFSILTDSKEYGNLTLSDASRFHKSGFPTIRTFFCHLAKNNPKAKDLFKMKASSSPCGISVACFCGSRCHSIDIFKQTSPASHRYLIENQ